MSATNDVCQPETFDLVVGAAILHHLIDPEEAIVAAGAALRPGGAAIFFEPFENGNAVLGLAYREILEQMDSRRERKRYKEGLDILRALGHDLETRRGRDKSDPIFRRIDDKWLFTRSFIEELAGKGGFASVDIRPIHSIERPFTQQTVTNLRLAANLGPEALPPWCWDKLASYDDAFSDDLKTDLFLEASIILRK
jgi:SAM-dependent methyltransferase